MAQGKLFVVATPIGNLGDVTIRALDVLRSVAVIACEDTRRTRVLMQRHGVKGTLVPFHKFNEKRASSSLVLRLLAGDDVALVSDGGTPAISDPGYRLVRDALDAGIFVTPIPGPSAFVAAVSASGLPSETLTFRGFLPHRGGERRRLIESIREDASTQVFYESPHRVLDSLGDLATILGDRPAAVARELTKRFETWYRGALTEIARQIARGPAKGEFCLVVQGALQRPRPAGRKSEGSRPRRTRPAESLADSRSDSPGTAQGADVEAPTGAEEPMPVSRAELRKRYQRALASGADKGEALRRVARECGLRRNELYKILNELKS